MINQINIHNFKSIQGLQRPLTLSPLNILIGANGAGKSNFISFFRLFKAFAENELKDYVDKEGGANNILHFGLKRSNFVGGSIEFDNKYAFPFALSPDKNGYFYLIEDKLAVYESGNLSQINIKEIEKYPEIISIIKSFMIYHFHDTSSTALIKQKNAIDDNRFLREDAGNLAAFLYWIQVKFPIDFKKIEAVVQSVAPFFDRFTLAPDRIREDLIQLSWREKGSDMPLYGRHFSDGTLRFIALVTLFLQPEPPPTIIIDEPELGLHPFAINKLAGLIQQASHRTQIIITTQSTNLIDNFEPEDIITVDRVDLYKKIKSQGILVAGSAEYNSTFTRLNGKALESWLEDYSLGELWNKNVIGGRP